MPRYQIITLVDITRTNPTRSDTDFVKLGQQANFNSLIQAIGLRANVEWSVDPIQHAGALPYPADGKATHWTWEFEVERDLLFQKDNDPAGLLKDDIDGVPVVNQLNNSVDIEPAVFQIKNNINIWISQIS
jgi:hypothetical protein